MRHNSTANSLSSLPIRMPLHPMEARSVVDIPSESGWQYEPKWDGFRCLIFRSGKTVVLQSKAEKDLTRYFPELVAASRELKAQKFVLDGEIVIPVGDALSFDALLQRIHPAESRIRKLVGQTPAKLIIFDILVDEKGKNLAQKALAVRRRSLEKFAKRFFPKDRRFVLSPATTDRKKITHWTKKAGNALDGVIAKRVDMPYRSDSRDGMVKIKNKRSADCVVGGFRYASKGHEVGSLLLGLYDSKGKLNHVGYVSVSDRLKKRELTKKLKALSGGSGFTGHAPDGQSRWSTERTADWQPLDPQLVIEVEFDHFTGARFRHGTKFLRWRPDKSPRQCHMDQAYQKKGSILPLLSQKK